jgi:hypothetical protein
MREPGRVQIGGAEFQYPLPLPLPFQWAPKKRRTRRELQAQSRRNALVLAGIFHAHHKAGDAWALMRTVHFCVAAGVVVPKWAADAFNAAFREVATKQAGSWDNVFGRPWPKGMHLGRARERDRLRWRVWSCVRSRRGRDAAAFDEVGEMFNMSGGSCRALYYETRDEVRDLFGRSRRRERV